MAGVISVQMPFITPAGPLRNLARTTIQQIGHPKGKGRGNGGGGRGRSDHES